MQFIFIPWSLIHFRSIVLEIMKEPNLARSQLPSLPSPTFHYTEPLASI